MDKTLTDEQKQAVSSYRAATLRLRRANREESLAFDSLYQAMAEVQRQGLDISDYSLPSTTPL